MGSNSRKLSLATVTYMFNQLSTNDEEESFIGVLLSIYSSFVKDNRFKYFDKYLSSFVSKGRDLLTFGIAKILIICASISHQMFNSLQVVSLAEINEFLGVVISPSHIVRETLERLLYLASDQLETRDDFIMFINICKRMRLNLVPINVKSMRMVDKYGKPYNVNQQACLFTCTENPTYNDVENWLTSGDHIEHKTHVLAVLKKVSNRGMPAYTAMCYLINTNDKTLVKKEEVVVTFCIA